MVREITSSSLQKLPYLDGIRGLMALNVVLCHFVVVYLPQMYYQSFASTIGGTLSYFAKTPLSVLVNGDIAVRYFLVLTGFLVGRTFFTQDFPPGQIPHKAVKRYKRLFPVLCFATVFTYLTMIMGLQKHLEISELVLNDNFLQYYCNFQPTILHMLVYLFLCPFLAYSAYVGPLWTLFYEFCGYILAMVICLVLKKYRWRKLCYVIMIGICVLQFPEHYIPLILGIFLADIRYNQNPDGFSWLYQKWIRSRAAIWGSFLFGLYFSCCPMDFVSIYAILGKIPHLTTGIVRAIGVVLVLHALLDMPRLQRVFSNSVLLFFGKFSYEVYAIHWPIMLTLEAWLFSRFIQNMPYLTAAVSAFLLTLPIIYITAYGMWVLLESNRIKIRKASK